MRMREPPWETISLRGVVEDTIRLCQLLDASTAKAILWTTKIPVNLPRRKASMTSGTKTLMWRQNAYSAMGLKVSNGVCTRN